MIFVVDQIVKSNSELSDLLEYISDNRIFKKIVNPTHDNKIVLFGEQLSHTMKIKEGNLTKRYESLFSFYVKGVFYVLVIASKGSRDRHKSLTNGAKKVSLILHPPSSLPIMEKGSFGKN